MRIRNFTHKGLKRLYHDDDHQGVPADQADKLRKILAFLQDMDGVGELRAIPFWKAHQMTGDRKGRWSLHVTRNWRLTFRIDTENHEICDVDYENYH